ncbi:hypothetical protein [Parasphingorhabdus sp.]|uniref:hypothetical protein n=1 Tax=Parasphingorhabdus sp. TaxID=2709688 RepID=UPI0032656CB2
MIKESVLFVASTGMLIYFLSPSGETPTPETIKAETQKKAVVAADVADDSWGEEEEEEEEENYEDFTFGQPITDSYDSEDDDEAWDEEESSYSEDAETANRAPSQRPTASRQKTASSNSPAPDDVGGINNPIIFKTNNPSNPVDD